MSWPDILGKAVGGLFSGGLLGIIGQGLVGWLDVWRADRESARKIAEIRALSEVKTEEAAWNAFAESQRASVPPANVPAWCAAVLTLFRPLLTVAALALAAWAFRGLDAQQRAGVVEEIFACAFGLSYWWFGCRHQQKLRR